MRLIESFNEHLKTNVVLGSGRSAAHLACLLAEAVPRYITRSEDMSTDKDLCKAIQSKFISRPPLYVCAFGVPKDKSVVVLLMMH
jgi:hypothetical protein